MIQINVEFFGPARNLAGADSARIELEDGADLSVLRRLLSQQYPALGRAMEAIRLAVNEAFVSEDTVLAAEDTVSVIPPVSGGTTNEKLWIKLVREPIPSRSVREFVEADATMGGVVTFEGVTRAETCSAHGPLARLEYEAHESMARRQLEQVGEQAIKRWPIERVAILHRLGSVPVTEVSVMIAVACVHRAECFDACRWIIDSLKRDVPIWKKNVFQDGHEQWVDPQGAPSPTSHER